nr:Na+/H+ antiporter NhaA [Arenimonas sp.]
MPSVKTLSRRAAQELADFMKLEASGGILLVMAAAIALVAANSPLAGAYTELFNLPVQLRAGRINLDKPLLLWINDGLMAVFFLLVALELKREMIVGQFADRAQMALPAACALAGMVVPMGIYAAVNWGDPVAMRGVAIPAATDIAFALGILALLGSRVPLALKMLLTAIAVADDLGAIVIIAVYYSHELSLFSLGLALAALASLVLLNRLGVTRLSAYLVIGALMWVAMVKSGVHATLAGVMLGMTIPLSGPGEAGKGPLEDLEDALHPWVAYAILPLFAFANAGVPLDGLSVYTLLQPVPMGIALGLFVGKQVGIFAAAAALIGSGMVRKPEGITWGGLYGMSILCGIGFTMSLF